MNKLSILIIVVVAVVGFYTGTKFGGDNRESKFPAEEMANPLVWILSARTFLEISSRLPVEEQERQIVCLLDSVNSFCAGGEKIGKFYRHFCRQDMLKTLFNTTYFYI